MGYPLRDRQEAAHKLLESPCEYNGLPKRKNADIILRLWLYPSFSHHHSWTIFEEGSQYFVRRITWDRQKDYHPGLPEPTTYGAEVLIAENVVRGILAKIQDIRLPSLSLDKTVCLDGETRGIEYSGKSCAVEIKWHSFSQAEWESFDEWFSLAIDTLNDMLPTNTS